MLVLKGDVQIKSIIFQSNIRSVFSISIQFIILTEFMESKHHYCKKIFQPLDFCFSFWGLKVELNISRPKSELRDSCMNVCVLFYRQVDFHLSLELLKRILRIEPESCLTVAWFTDFSENELFWKKNTNLTLDADFVNFWPKSQVEGLATELPNAYKKCVFVRHLNIKHISLSRMWVEYFHMIVRKWSKEFVN